MLLVVVMKCLLLLYFGGVLSGWVVSVFLYCDLGIVFVWVWVVMIVFVVLLFYVVCWINGG